MFGGVVHMPVLIGLERYGSSSTDREEICRAIA